MDQVTFNGFQAVSRRANSGETLEDLLLHFDGSNGGTTFTDSGKNNFTMTAGGAVLPTTVTTNQKFGSACGDFADGYIATPSSSVFNFADKRLFTIDGWFRWDSLIENSIFSTTITPKAVTLFDVVNNGSQLRLLVGNAALSGWSSTTFSSSGLISTGTYYHIALVGDGTNLKLYLNGTARISSTHIDWPSANRIVYIGRGSETYMDGRVDEFRVRMDAALFTGTFTPPTTPYT